MGTNTISVSAMIHDSFDVEVSIYDIIDELHRFTDAQKSKLAKELGAYWENALIIPLTNMKELLDYKQLLKDNNIPYIFEGERYD